MSVREHKKTAPRSIRIGIITVSSTRTLPEDKSGMWICKTAKKEGHQVLQRRIVPDDAALITKTVLDLIREHSPQAVVLTGGTGISNKDVTIEAVRPLLVKELPGFSAIFAQLSFEEIDSAAILSRAIAGVTGETVLFCIPGSLKACKLACKSLIFPELGHIVKHIVEK